MRFEQKIMLSAPREAVWRLVADNERLNREMGLPPVRFTFAPREVGGTQVTATMQKAGLSLRYDEQPFDFVRPVYYTENRTFETGPFHRITGGVQLAEAGSGTEVLVWGDFEPSGPLGNALCRPVGRKMIADFIAVCHSFEAWLTGRSTSAYPRHSGRPPADRERLQRLTARLVEAGVDGAIAARLAEHVAEAPPEDTLMMRPYALADRWGQERRTVLQAFLMAARIQLLELRWRVLCPSCRGAKETSGSLRELSPEVHCESCNIRFDAAFDRSVEVCFNVAPAVRKVEDVLYCIGGPMHSPHIMAQWILEPGERRRTAIEMPAGSYSLESLQCGAGQSVEVSPDGGAGCVGVRLVLGEGTVGANGAIVLASGGEAATSAVWEITNALPHRAVLRLETPQWTTDAVTAAEVTSLQMFRDQFGSEVLSPGVDLAVKQICVLFSDLKGSTAMYRERGDAPSYRAVREHFAMLREIVGQSGGAIVKTIGDAVMATFIDPADALSAAFAIQKRAAREGDLIVKLGLHYGPAIAVNANDLLDYFGQTVNMAARLQRASEGGDVVIARELADDPRVRVCVENAGAYQEPFEAPVRGLETAVKMIRLTPPAERAELSEGARASQAREDAE